MASVSPRRPRFHTRLLEWYRHLGFLPKLAVWVVLLAPFFAVGGYFVAKPWYKAWKQANALKLGQALVEKGDMNGASQAFRRALRANPKNPEAWRAVAKFLKTLGSPEIVGAYQQLVKLEPHNIDQKFLLIDSAIQAKRPMLARDVMAEFPESAREDARYLQAEGLIAADRGEKGDAIKFLQRALEKNPSLPDVRTQLDVAKLGSSDATLRSEGLDDLQRMSEQPGEQGIRALRELLTDAVSRKDMLSISVYVSKIVGRPEATFRDRLARVDFELSTKSLFAPLAINDLESYAEKNPANIYPAVEYLIARGQLANAERWIGSLPEDVQQTPVVRAANYEIKVAKGDWDDAFNLMEEGFGDVIVPVNVVNAARKAFELHSVDAADGVAQWQGALRDAPNVRTLALLLGLARAEGWDEAELLVANAIVKIDPNQAPVWREIIQVQTARRNLLGIYDGLIGASRAAPDDVTIRSDLILVSGLLNKGDPQELLSQAKVIYEYSPQNPFYVTSYAMALLRAGKTNEAVAAIDTIGELERSLPERALYRGVIYAAAGRMEDASAALNLAKPTLGRMLPEESVLFVTTTARIEGRTASEDEIKAQLEKATMSEVDRENISATLRAARSEIISAEANAKLAEQLQAEKEAGQRSPDELQALIKTIRESPSTESEK